MMGYEAFTSRYAHPDFPAASLGKEGRIYFNRSATEIFLKTESKYALLLWDKDTRKIAVQRALKTDRRAYRITMENRACVINAKAFLSYINYDRSHTRSFAAEWNQKDEMFEIDVWPVKGEG